MDDKNKELMELETLLRALRIILVNARSEGATQVSQALAPYATTIEKSHAFIRGLLYKL